MRNVYLSFLGLGSYDEKTGKFDYKETVYELDSIKSTITRFIQVAEIQIIGAEKFDLVFIITTQKSKDAHYSELARDLGAIGAKRIANIMIDEDMSDSGQWRWFEEILSVFEMNDVLTVDMTHGYRAAPIVMSAAINFLQNVKKITLEAVYYGAYDKNRNLTPIINLKSFYDINSWAGAVNTLVEDADARKLANLVSESAEYQFEGINDKELSSLLIDLTESIRNVDVNKTSGLAKKVTERLDGKSKCSKHTILLLNLIKNKFGNIESTYSNSHYYTKDYFLGQLEIIELLIGHQLHMQAFTAMREMIASLGMLYKSRVKIETRDGRDRRGRFGEMFVNMLQFDRSKWEYGTDMAMKKGRDINEKDLAWDKLIPFYDKLDQDGIVDIFRTFVKDLVDARNGFDHAWTIVRYPSGNIKEKGGDYLLKLRNIVHLLIQNEYFQE